ncbi:glutamine synthetase [Streptomyces thinghirensis]|nr:glutamine synthetase [Streptomyces thinghirensis]
MDKQQEFVIRTLEERDIRFVRLWFTDVLGFLKSVAVARRSWSRPSTRASVSTARRSRASPGSTSPT